MESEKEKIVMIDGKQYKLIEVDNGLSELVEQFNNLSAEDQYFQKMRADVDEKYEQINRKRDKVISGVLKFISILILSPILLISFLTKFFLGLLKVVLVWLMIKASVLLGLACFLAIFDSWLHWVSHEWATQVMDFMMLHLWGAGELKTTTTMLLFPHLQIEIIIILVLNTIVSFFETYDLYLNSKMP